MDTELMNRLKGRIINIESSESISLVEVKTEIGNICAVVVETPKTSDYLKVNNSIYVLFKETEVSIGKELSGMISLRNRFECIVEEIQKGKVLTRLVLRCRDKTIKSVITTRSAENMNIKKGDFVIALVKTNEVSLMEIPDGN
ncbi:TOBE domain-containing protein [Persephonella sp.]|uniref:TOBE domain-containing protein n=1 Tax=Persephonella sp. TaxID=2060922 RepID=UPI0025F2CEF5|nr:TOBE domain-containing protein [Persephonella sp.]